MSIHLVNEAARRRIKPSHKLVLLALAESARDVERRAWPGIETLTVWAGVSQPRVYKILNDLSELRLIEQVKRGQKYQRAEYVVFPDGCCDAHSAAPGREAEAPVDTLAHKTLSESQGRLSDSQGLVSDVSGSCPQDPSRKINLHYIQGLSTSSTSPGEADQDCEHGVDRHSSCRDCAAEGVRLRRASGEE